jgi:hypothetical protein
MEGLTITLLLRDVLKGQNIKRPAENDNVTNCRTCNRLQSMKVKTDQAWSLFEL